MQTDSNRQELTNEELKLIDIIIKNPFASNSRLAEITGLHRTTISKIKSKPHIQARIHDFTRSNIERFQEIQEEALEVYAKLMKSKKDFIKLAAAKPFVESLKTTKIDLDAKVEENIIITMTPVKPE